MNRYLLLIDATDPATSFGATTAPANDTAIRWHLGDPALGLESSRNEQWRQGAWDAKLGPFVAGGDVARPETTEGQAEVSSFVHHRREQRHQGRDTIYMPRAEARM